MPKTEREVPCDSVREQIKREYGLSLEGLPPEIQEVLRPYVEDVLDKEPARRSPDPKLMRTRIG